MCSTFLNSTDDKAAQINGNNGTDKASAKALAAAAYRHPVSHKPAIVLYAEPKFEAMWDAYVAATPGSIGHLFHVGYADGMSSVL